MDLVSITGEDFYLWIVQTLSAYEYYSMTRSVHIDLNSSTKASVRVNDFYFKISHFFLANMARISFFLLPAMAGNTGRASEANAAAEEDISAALLPPLLPLLIVELLLLKLDVLPSSIKPLPTLLVSPKLLLEARERLEFPLILRDSGEGIPPSKKPTLLLASILCRLEAVDDS